MKNLSKIILVSVLKSLFASLLASTVNTMKYNYVIAPQGIIKNYCKNKYGENAFRARWLV